MTGRSPPIVVTLPARGLDAARREIREAAEQGADLAEVRFDRWSAADRHRAAELFPSSLPLVATLRSRAEGGEGPDELSERSPLLRTLAALPFRWIDLEVDRDREEGLGLPPAAALGRIHSVHRPEGLDPTEWARRVRTAPRPGHLDKLVVAANVGTALGTLLPSLPPPGEASVVTLTTGPSGPLLRALSRRLGLPLVFAALPEPTDPSRPRPSVEPSQIPIDRLRPFLRAEGSPPLFALLGHPVAHSKSPRLHTSWMRREGRAGLYLSLDIGSEEEFVDALPGLAEWGFRGLNVTHPWKSAALAVATDVGPGARATGAANCLTLGRSEIEAENTDLGAVLRRMEELVRQGRWNGRTVSVVGTGGAARATLAAARIRGAETRLFGRNSERVAELARSFGAAAPPIRDRRPEGLVVHATEVGREGTPPLAVSLEPLLGTGVHVVDWVYDPEIPHVRDAAHRAGATYEDGTRLLVYQAAASYGIWWGEAPDEDAVALALREEGCAD